MDRARRTQALVVASLGWQSGLRGRADRGFLGAPSAPRTRVGRQAIAGGTRPLVDEEGSAPSPCGIGPYRPRTSGSTRSL
eukprot:4483409-Pyramimonas_sp.AAC.1